MKQNTMAQDSIRAVRQMGGFWRFFRPYRKWLGTLAVTTVLGAIATLLAPYITQLIIDQAYPAGDTERMLRLGVSLILLGLFSTVMQGIAGFVENYVSNLVTRRLCLRIYKTLDRLPSWRIEKLEQGAYLQRITADANLMGTMGTSICGQLAFVSFSSILALALMLSISWWITCLMLVTVPVNYWLSLLFGRRLRNYELAGRGTLDQITSFVNQSTAGAAVARLFKLRTYRRKRFKTLLRDIYRIAIEATYCSVLWGQLSGLNLLIWGGMLNLGGWYLVFTNRLTLGQAVAIGWYMMILYKPFRLLEGIYRSLMTTSASAERIQRLLDDERQRCQRTIRLLAPPTYIELKNVTFGYDDHTPVLHDINLRLNAEDVVIVIGPNGSGKSTLLRILAGMDDRYQGVMEVGGHDFQAVDLATYQDHISVVPQSLFFFEDTVQCNLGLNNGNRPNHEKLELLTQRLRMSDFTTPLPQFLERELSPRGMPLSVGQYRKLAVLRALLKNAGWLLLDEPTSSMDAVLGCKTLEAILQLKPPGGGVVMVTHDISASLLPSVTKIVSILGGRIVQVGAPAQLRAQPGYYRDWVSPGALID